VAKANRKHHDSINSFVTLQTNTHLPLPVQPVLMDENEMKLMEIRVVGALCIKFPWPGIARTIWAIIKDTRDYFSAFPATFR
jgi:acetyl-CoA synthetase